MSLSNHSGAVFSGSVVVIGAGVVGLCTALQAQRKGYTVTLIDRDMPGNGASFGNAGYLATELIDPLSTAKTVQGALGMLLNPDGPLALPIHYLHRSLPWLARFVTAARSTQVVRSREGLIALNRKALDAWRRCLSDIDASEQLLQSGYLLVWESADRLLDAKTHAQYLAQWGVKTELVEGARLAQLEPALAETASHALYFPEACQVREPYQLCRLLFAAFEARDGRFLRQTVDKLTADIHQVSVSNQEAVSRFEYAIICAGAWSRTLLQQVGVDVPLEAERGYHISMINPAVNLNRPIGSAERRFVLSPLGSGLRAVGFTEFGGLSLGPFSRRFDTLRKHTLALLPGLARKPVNCQEWMGHRPTLPDSLPVIDRHPDYGRLLFAFGNQHLGLTQAAVSAEIAVSLMTGEQPPVDPHPYRVDRF